MYARRTDDNDIREPHLVFKLHVFHRRISADTHIMGHLHSTTIEVSVNLFSDIAPNTKYKFIF